MKAIKSLLFSLLAVATSSAPSAESPTSLLSHAGAYSFSTNVPEGWVVVSRESSGSYNGGTLLFDLVPSGSSPSGKITVAHYPNKVPITAQLYWEGLTYDGNVELPRLTDLSAWIMFGKGGRRDGNIGTAYYSLGGGTLVFDLSSDDYDQGEKVFLALLRSFRDLGKTN